ncbi:helicase-related protein [Selenomonas bovis]|uniref:helicase-related protein n=1 Tax=Selenomonas bovis TaxID=416586 RepID=UPI0004E0EA14|nr:helicase-related protein [Selenomonas bovis]
MQLRDFVVGSKVNGLEVGKTVEIVAVKHHGDMVADVTYKDANGNLNGQMVYADQATEMELSEKALPWSFDADADRMRLVSEAYRIHLAYLFDPYLAVHTSSIEPLPHQISAVYEKMLPRQPLRFVLADDPGAGKTIMTGLLMKELIMRGDIKRCLIVCPGNLAEQWQDELHRKFHLRFEILTNDRVESSVTGNIFMEMNFCIARLDKLSRSEALQEKLKIIDWDLIIVDEAHKMSATVWGGEVRYTKRFQLGRLLSSITRHFLLLTATPHNGKDADFALFMSLIDADRFEGVKRDSQQAVDVSDVMRRLVKEELLKFDGKPLFPERIAYTVNYDLSPMEARLYQEVTEYVQDGFNRAERLENERKNTVGFALTILQRRLASSPAAIYCSLDRRAKRLTQLLQEEKLKRRASEFRFDFKGYGDADDFDDAPSSEIEEAEDEMVAKASASQTIAEMEEEIRTLHRLTKMAGQVRASGEDRKWDELSRLLQENKNIVGANGEREKLIIFTEHKDTLYYLQEKISSLLGRAEAVVTIHGGMVRDERRKVEERFKQDKEVLVLIATDAAGEGINLQRAHLMINYDLPWNPNRLEQRFGRIHRIGQTEVCYLWNLVAKETREGDVFQRLFGKLEEERKALGGKVFDILGKLTFENKPLRELLIEAIRYGNDPKIREKLNTVMDSSLNRKKLKEILTERALTEDVMNPSTVSRIREDMERMEARKLQPFFIESFFLAAFKSLNGRIYKREPGRYEITRVPFDIRNRDMQIGFGEPVLSRYERICFDKEQANIPGLVPASFVTPGHPLLSAISDLVREKYGSDLKQGTIFIDDADDGEDFRILFYIENSIQDGVASGTGQRRVISKRVHFVEIKKNGEAVSAGFAPYLDYRAPNDDERNRVLSALQQESWLKDDVEDIAVSFAIQNIIPNHLNEVRDRKKVLLDKTESAVKERLTSEIQYWDFRANELREKESLGKRNAKLNADQAARRAEELTARLEKRLSEIAQERKITAMPPVVVGGALIVPKGWFVQNGNAETNADAQSRAEIEKIAMHTVTAIEYELGYEPKDVSAEKCGYDIESLVPEKLRDNGNCLRFIEVKGRCAEADTVTVSKNEILTALNKPDEYILAIVMVDGDKTKTTYLQHPFTSSPDFGAVSVTYKINDLLTQAKCVLEK